MTFADALADARNRADTLLRDWLPETPEVVPARLAAAMRHGALAGGKRFRPFLVIESARLFGDADTAATVVAAALECVHAYSLVHDDLPAMDNDRLRRGEPTVWAAYDEWTAILAGDALLTLAFEKLAEPAAHPDPGVRVALIAGLAAASGGAGMVGGQVIDLMADKLGQPRQADAAHVRRLQEMKTGALIRYACEAGAILGGATPVERAALLRYGAELGFAFQISDDLLDAEGDTATVGKATGKDAAANKATLVSLMGTAAAREALAAAVVRATQALAPFGARATVLVAAAESMLNRQS
jgi:farnesyl diphosphate synthase